MFEHVNGEQLVVKRRYWRPHRDPDQEQSDQTTDTVLKEEWAMSVCRHWSQLFDIGV